MRLWRFGILQALVHRVLKDGNFDLPAKKKTDKTRLSLTTVKRPEMKDVLKETGKLIKVPICFWYQICTITFNQTWIGFVNYDRM